MSATVRNLGGGGGKAQGYIIPASDSVSISGVAGTTATVNLTVIGDGALSVSSSDSTKATGFISGNILTITAVASGNATITITMADSSTYLGTTATISVECNLVTVGSTYKLGSGAHTGGTADAKATVLAVDTTNNTAIMASNGLYGGKWAGTGELTSAKTTYFGDLADAISGVYLPRGNADGSETTTTPTDIFVYDGSSFVNTYSSEALSVLAGISADRNNYGSGTVNYGGCLGTPYDANRVWFINGSGGFSHQNYATYTFVNAPTFILDLTKVKLHGDRIIDKDAVVPKIVTWANGTDAEVVAMVEAADEGVIDLSEYWSVGDERAITLSAMQASGTASNGVTYSVGETHVSQTVTLVLMNRGGKRLSSGGMCNFVFGLKNMLANNGTFEGGYMNSTGTNAGGWNSCARRNWCNGAFYDAFPSTLRPILKQFINHTATGNSTSATDSTDWFALASEVEIFGATTNANATAETGNTQFEYYTTSANRIKNQGDAGSAYYWWERSPDSGNSSIFCNVSSSGGANNGNASLTLGLAPIGCL